MTTWRIEDEDGNVLQSGFPERGYAMAAKFLYYPNDLDKHVVENDGAEVVE